MRLTSATTFALVSDASALSHAGSLPRWRNGVRVGAPGGDDVEHGPHPVAFPGDPAIPLGPIDRGSRHAQDGRELRVRLHEQPQVGSEVVGLVDLLVELLLDHLVVVNHADLKTMWF